MQLFLEGSELEIVAPGQQQQIFKKKKIKKQAGDSTTEKTLLQKKPIPGLLGNKFGNVDLENAAFPTCSLAFL